jgi:hypothetical protein
MIDRLKHAWNAFTSIRERTYDDGPSYGQRPDRLRMSFSNERSIIASIFTRIAIDVAALDIRHVRLDKDDRYESDMVSGLNECLRVSPNLDQGPRMFKQDVAMSLFDQGTIAIVPVDTTFDPNNSGSFDIKSLRVGRIVTWKPQRVRVEVYNEKSGRREEVDLDKSFTAIVENPLFAVMNEPNSTLQRLIRKLNLLDAVDEQSSSGKLDMIIQLPYTIKSESRRKQAEQRRIDIEHQLKGSQYGIAYADGTEKITQLNRPAENNLLKQVEYLTTMLYGQLGLTAGLMDGTADQQAMLNYYNRTIEPILEAVLEAMRRTFLTKTARSQKQWILAFRDPFKLVPVTDIAEIADKFSRNRITSANEIRQAIGMKPSKDPDDDRHVNSNMPEAKEESGNKPIDPGVDERLPRNPDTDGVGSKLN